MSTLYLCGVGNGEGIRLALHVSKASGRWERIVLLDDDPKTHGTRRLGLEVAGAFELLAGADRARDSVVNLVTRTTRGRAKARARIASFGVPFASLVHPGVDLLGTELGEEVTIYPMASIGAEAHVARSSVVLIGGLVGHGARVGEGCVIAPYAVINARVRLGREVYVGSNASILPDLNVGDGATIAANTLVVTDVPAGATALGVPAAILPSRESAPPAGPTSAEAHPAHAELAPADAAEAAQLEAEIEAIVQGVLGVEAVARTSNFFDAGGTSLKALQLCERLHTQLGLEVQVVDVYQHPTLDALLRALSGAGGGPALDQARQRGAQRRHRGRR